MANPMIAQKNSKSPNSSSSPGVVTKTSNPGSAVSAAGPDGKHVPGTRQGTAPAEAKTTFGS